ncbi:MAG: cupredoxin family copper-binding protein [Methanomicrobiales archaeon]|nr:cupredoxin family copper-binding protein [Methanomicrobiales archaeon]
MAERIALRGILVASLVLLLLLSAGCTGTGTGQPGTVTPTTPPAPETTLPDGGTTPEEPVTTPTEVESVVEVLIRDFSFAPATLTVSAGTTVIWTNEDSVPHQVASDPHPAHTGLPGLLSEPIPPGESYRFTFTQAGTYGYHCELHPSMTGTITVEE